MMHARKAFRRLTGWLCLLLLPALTGCPERTGRHLPSQSLVPSGAPAPLFRDVAQSSGLSVRWGPREPSGLTIRDMMGYGCAFLDYDGDGKLDALFVTNDHLELYRNIGGGRFENVTARAFPGAVSRPYLMGCSVCDYDEDGRPDIFVSGYGQTVLYHNEGGAFRDVTAGSGLAASGPYDWTTSAAWADVDGDGRPDLYVCRYVRFTPADHQFCTSLGSDGNPVQGACQPTVYAPQKGSLYLNKGNGRFRDVTAQSGLSGTHGNGLGSIFCDFNTDGKPDLYVANDQKPGDLFVNLGHAKFRNVGAESGTAFSSNGGTVAGMGIAWGDYNNDGKFDLLVSNFSGQPKLLFHNQGNGIFVDTAQSAGIVGGSFSSLTFSAELMDIDNDGLLDIFLLNGGVHSLVDKADTALSYRQPSNLFRNLGNGHFADLSALAGPDVSRKIVGRGAAAGDYDGDGRLDLLVVDAEGVPMLLHNEGHGNHAIMLRVLKAGGKADAIGARVTLTAGGRRQVRQVCSGGSYLSTDAPELHFGVGAAERIDAVTVNWPTGATTTYHGLEADHHYRIVQGNRDPVRL